MPPSKSSKKPALAKKPYNKPPETYRSPASTRSRPSPRPKSNSLHASEQARRGRRSTRLSSKHLASKDPPEAFLIACAKKLAIAYEDGLIVTFNPRTVEWEEVAR